MNTDLYNSCVLFRKAIERTPKEELSICFSKFPRASCSAASQILGLHLAHQGFGSFDHVCGELHYYSEGSWFFYYSHSWLERDDLIVDITGDQFKCRPPVYVGSKDFFFSRFVTNSWNRHPYYASLISPSSCLLNDYQKVLAYLY